MREWFFVLKTTDILRFVYTNWAAALLVIGVPAGIVAGLAAYSLMSEGVAVLRDPGFWVDLAVVLLLPVVVALVGGGVVGYGVENCSLYVKAHVELRLPLDSVVVRLVPYSDYKSVLRTWGTGIPGLVYGRVILRNGAHAVAIVYRPERLAMLLEGGGKVVLIAHPGVEETYRRLVEMRRACTRSRGAESLQAPSSPTP